MGEEGAPRLRPRGALLSHSQRTCSTCSGTRCSSTACRAALQGKDYVETAHVACCHLFNHQTHHRAQVHVMLSQTSTPPPALDLHRILHP